MHSHLGSSLIDIGTARLYHEVCGTGPTVLLIAGATGGAEQWTPCVPCSPVTSRWTCAAGKAFLIPAGTVHNAQNNGSGLARVLATFIVEKGKPLATTAAGN